ncbi:MAG: NAD(P)/FAD-dependent oxidoreductase, partial [Firmicutes bacterium]|nr:NAD(P)/FAD-dependent oxidoreductase [Bacillota bacterium]
GAGAIQTLMNSHGIMPAKEVVMLGAGNIGLIVSYQLIQAGVKVKAIMCGGPKIGGYLVHASKLRRMGVPILTNHSIERANGTDKLESVTLVKMDDNYQKIKGSEFDIKCDNLCISAGLSPLTELLWQMGCQMKYVTQLGGHVALRTEKLETSRKNVFIAGDVTAVEEASSAMMQGQMVGIETANRLGFFEEDDKEKIKVLVKELATLRSGDTAAKIREGLKFVEVL